jgi:hypothetical protein
MSASPSERTKIDGAAEDIVASAAATCVLRHDEPTAAQ